VPALTTAGLGARFRFILFTDDPALAAAADAAGVARVGVDIESLGKAERQANRPLLRLSGHRLEQLPAVRGRLRQAQALVRCNPLHPGTEDEVGRALAAGADVLMLPWFHTAAEAARFVEIVAGRAEVSLLVESPGALADVAAIARLPGISDIVVGLNDLSLALGLPGPFALAASPVLDRIAAAVHAAGVPFGFGGIADPEHHALPVAPQVAHARLAELGATSAFVARSFSAGGLQAPLLAAGLERCRAELDRWERAPLADREACRLGIAGLIPA
jgi:citrate lyase beta subunit